MTKHSFFICLLIISTILVGCKQKSEFVTLASTDEESASEAYAEEVVITGKVLNWDAFPNEKEVVLVVPFFRDFGDEYRATIQKDSSFVFHFPVYARMREVSISNYAEHIYVRPSDSLNVVIDFKDLFHPKVTGGAEKMNQEIFVFAENGYYYMKEYTLNYDQDSIRFGHEIRKEYDLRIKRRNEFLQKYKPMPDVVLLTEELLKQDYYYHLLKYASQWQLRSTKNMQSYRSMFPDIEMLYNKGIISARLFDIAEECKTYISNGILVEEKKTPTLDSIMSITGQNKMNQYLVANELTANLFFCDTTALSRYKQEYDSIVKLPYLRERINQLYKKAKLHLEGSKSDSSL